MHQQFITEETLTDANIDLIDQDVDALLIHLNDMLQERVGAEITDTFSESQIQTLIDMQENASDDELSVWLEQNVPNLQKLVQSEIDAILDEISEEDVDDADDQTQTGKL